VQVLFNSIIPLSGLTVTAYQGDTAVATVAVPTNFDRISSSGGSTVSVSGLQGSTAYTFAVTAINSYGPVVSTRSDIVYTAGLNLAPTNATVVAGTGQAYTTHLFSNGSVGDVTGATSFTIDGTACGGTTCTATAVGTHVITATDGSQVTTANLTVVPATLASIALSPNSAAITAGSSQPYAVTGYDTYGNSLGEVTSSAILSIAPNGGCSATACAPTTVGAHTVTATYAGLAATATLNVNAGSLNSITISPASGSITVNAPRFYTATSYDAYNNSLGDVTGATTFSISGGGYCGSDFPGEPYTPGCASLVAGSHTVTGTYNGKTATAILTVTAGPVASITINPASSTINSGSQTYTTTGYDSYNNLDGDVTSLTTFQISGGGSCSGARCTGPQAGTYTVTATYNLNHSAQALASLTTLHAVITQLQIGPESSPRGRLLTGTLASSSQAGTLLVAVIHTTSGTVSVTGPTGWVNAATANQSSGGWVQIWYYPNNPGGIYTATFTVTPGWTVGEVQLTEWSGVKTTSPLDKSGTFTTGANAFNATVSTSAATSIDNELVITSDGALVQPGLIITRGIGWTGLVGDNANGFISDYRTNLPAGIESETLVSSPAGTWALAIAAFKPA
jgi:hypothetical protein